MDFALTEDQQAIVELSNKMLSEVAHDDKLKALDREGTWFHARAWKELGSAALLGLSLDEEQGGSGFGMVELTLVARACGANVVPIPLVSSAFGAAWALANFADDDTRASLLTPLLAGESVVALAIEEPTSRDLLSPSVCATASGALTGAKTNVVAGMLASHAVVTASCPSGPALYLVALDGPGVTRAAQRNTDGTQCALVTFDAVAATLLSSDAGVLDVLKQRVQLGAAAEVLGVCDGAIALTAEFTRTRKQFGVPIGMFQAVKQRIADAYIARNALEVCVLRAAWQIANGEPAEQAVAQAAWWAAEAGHVVTTAAQHLHGGMGFDRDYPVHRYFLRAKRHEFSLGTAPELLEELGDIIAGQGPSASGATA